MGIGDGIIPDILNRSIYDEIYIISDKEALEILKRLAREEAPEHNISGAFSMPEIQNPE